MHEITGLTPECILLAKKIAGAGFTVYLPILFGQPVSGSPIVAAGNFLAFCISREFRKFAQRKSSSITEWLRALCREAFKQCGGSGVGAIGMCLTGGFVLSLMVDEWLMAPVIAQPSLPLNIPPFNCSEEYRASLGVSPDQLEQAKQQAKKAPILALRFTQDPFCPIERLATLEKEFAGNIEVIRINSGSDNPDGIPANAHATLTTHFSAGRGSLPYQATQDALDRVILHLQRGLLTKIDQ
jgi:dienelactone hydrolase